MASTRTTTETGEEAPERPRETAPVGLRGIGASFGSPLYPLAPARLALARFRRGWRLLLVTGVGILVAVVLICTVPLYNILVRNVQLQHTLTAAAITETNVEVQVAVGPPARGVAEGVLSSLAQVQHNRLASFAPTAMSYYQLGATLPLAAIYPPGPGATARTLPDPMIVDPFSFNLDQAAPYMHLIAGRLPRDVPDGQPLEVLTTPKMGAHVGDTLALSIGDNKTLRVTVAGIWYPKNEQDRFWNARSFDTVWTLGAGATPPAHTPVLFTTNGFFALFAGQPQGSRFVNFTQSSIICHDVFFPRLTRITAANLDQVLGDVQGMHRDINEALLSNRALGFVQVGTQLDQLLTTVQRQLNTLALPLYIIVAQVIGLALLFVIAMASLFVEAQAAEIATLRSRGASLPQLLGVYAAQGLGIVAVAVLIGPFAADALALAIVRLLMPQRAGDQIPSAHFLASTISPTLVLEPALVGALLGLAALVFAAWQATRLDVLAFRRAQGRDTHVPLWRRYYLDLGLVVLCAAGYLELGQFGGLSVRAQLGQTQSGPDPLLLVTPGLLLLAGALLVLRLFPLGARLGIWIARRGRGAAGLLSFAQLARGGAQFTRLTMLLALAVGMGLFALTFQGSLGQNAAAQAAFLTGGDQRLVVPQPVSFPTLSLLSTYRQLPGVTGVMPVYRGAGQTADSTHTAVDVLAVDASAYTKAAYWQSSYADQPIAALMSQMRAHQQGTRAGTKGHPIWALVSRSLAGAAALQVGDTFSMTPSETSNVSFIFTVGAIVNYIPTLDDPAVPNGMMVDQADYLAALENPISGVDSVSGPNEFWLRDNGDRAERAERLRILRDPLATQLAAIDDRWTLQDQFITDPLTSGMIALLLVSAIVAAALAIFGVIVQSAVAARQRLTQFAILRTLGVSRAELVRMLLGQQVIVYAFGLVGGTALGVLLATATLPFLQFISSAIGIAGLQLPPYTLVFDGASIALFYAALLLACVVALAVGAGIALRVGLGKALRIGED